MLAPDAAAVVAPVFEAEDYAEGIEQYHGGANRQDRVAVNESGEAIDVDQSEAAFLAELSAWKRYRNISSACAGVQGRIG